MQGHTVKSFDADLSELDQKIAEMGGHCERLLAEAFAALERRDPSRALAATSADKTIDALDRELQDLAVLIIARRQPMAVDLRHVMTVIKIASDLERIGDLAKNIAKRAVAVAHEAVPKSLLSGLGHMTDYALSQLKDVLDAYAGRDADKAMDVWREDARLDMLYNSIFREMLTYMMEDPRNITLCTHLLFGAKNLERIGDHTTNIAENVHFLVHGTMPDGTRPKSDDTSSLVVVPPRRGTAD
ncbi:MAG: phosphate signaling complex protein PhoU [Hyphomicrobiales bacterium]|nr:phosphate signaling complex protein PhoU [Hyphomicrobiales bacterium]